ncbi:DUF1761 domain-containing protein [Sinisalibacter lacisalsi]|uniref:DUF1761 domain-containing protein n=1 Tax=Sinisalibacter lacisalsi TaxID=1526570 RepID=A0ABQ1QB65_9RHOB|nr:DUF1761 domain-containing protein [Sinisalibacter lacisalsi]GGD21176.1 hypothetical protein GCM10011358_02050 [Sinisalibacter lacisalsi]
MEILSVLAAALAAWLFGAAWYMALSRPWLDAAGLERDEHGRPKDNAGPLPYILSAIAMVLVAGMMRHIIEQAQIDTVLKGIMVGGGIGLFMISPWIMINNAYVGRPFRLTLIDGGYAVFGSAIIGSILVLL